MEAWHILVTLGIIALIAEIFTAGFISSAIGVGLFFAAIGNYLDLDAKWQILLFALGLALAYLFIRPIMMKYGYGSDKIETNQGALIGRTGVVTEEINNKLNTGRIRIDGDDWKARIIDDGAIKLGEVVEVVGVKSIILIVNQKK